MVQDISIRFSGKTPQLFTLLKFKIICKVSPHFEEKRNVVLSTFKSFDVVLNWIPYVKIIGQNVFKSRNQEHLINDIGIHLAVVTTAHTNQQLDKRGVIVIIEKKTQRTV